ITPKDVEFPSWTNFIQIPYSYSLDFLNNNPIIIDDRPTIIPLSPPYNQHTLSPSFQNYSQSLPSERGNDGVSRRFTYQTNRISAVILDQDKTRRRSSEFPSETTSNVPLSPPVSPKTTFETLLPGQVFVCTISNTSYLVNIHAEPYKHHRPIH
ncbi:11664_t:CDS:1, partial [Cetraspora pellucida]